MAGPYVRNTSLSANNAAPAEFYVSVTPSDSVDLVDGATRALWVDVAGNISAIDGRGNTNTFAVTAGFNNLGGLARIRATGTTATGIKAVY